MPYWRFAVSILLGAVGTPLFYLGFREMYGMIAEQAKTKTERRMAKVFRVGYLTGTIYWTYVHALCLILAIVLKSVYETGGNLDAAAAAAQKVLFCNAVPAIPGSELKRAVDRVAKCEEQLAEFLDEEGKHILTRLTLSQQEANSIIATENFILGFRLGVRLVADCMDGNDGDIRSGGE